MVLVVHAANAAQLVHRSLVVQMAGQGITGVGGHRENAALVQQRNSLFEQARLRVVGVDVKTGPCRINVPSSGQDARRQQFPNRREARGQCGKRPEFGVAFFWAVEVAAARCRQPEFACQFGVGLVFRRCMAAGDDLHARPPWFLNSVNSANSSVAGKTVAGRVGHQRPCHRPG